MSSDSRSITDIILPIECYSNTEYNEYYQLKKNGFTGIAQVFTMNTHHLCGGSLPTA